MTIHCRKQIKQVAKLRATNRMQNMQIRGRKFHFWGVKNPICYFLKCEEHTCGNYSGTSIGENFF